MKKINLFYALAATALVFGACSKTVEVADAPQDAGERQQIVLQVVNGGDDITTRAGRPLYSEEANQTIENVTVIICNSDLSSGNVAVVKTIADWQNDQVSSVYTDNGHGRKTTIELAGEDKLKPGSYKVYAVGYNTGSEYGNIQTGVAQIKKGDTFNENLKLTMAEGTDAEEIFAGSLELTVASGKGFKTPVILNRQVAGSFGYLSEIPYIQGAEKIRLVAFDRNNGLVLGNFANTLASETSVKYVVNGTDAAASKVIYEIDLNQWFTAIQADEKGMIDTTQWKNPLDGKANFARGSVYGGNFVIPFAKDASLESPKNTFELQLTNAAGDKVYRTWIVKLPSSDKQLSSHELYKWGTNAFDLTGANTDSQTCYNVVRNHLYGIGKRTTDNPTIDPDKPNPDVDDPQSLNNKQELILQVNDNWEVIHRMELE